MDWGRISGELQKYTRKNKCVLLVLAVGILLMSIPNNKKAESNTIIPEEKNTYEDHLQSDLEDILRNLYGAGSVRVLLTKASGEEIRFQSDESSNQADTLKTQTVLVTDAQRTQSGLIRQINPPKYLGAVVLCTGADNPDVCYSISKAVSSATGLSFDKITVLKMNDLEGTS